MTKMSSSQGNVINITDTPNDMFAKVMRLPDELIVSYFILTTKIPMREIAKTWFRLSLAGVVSRGGGVEELEKEIDIGKYDDALDEIVFGTTCSYGNQ